MSNIFRFNGGSPSANRTKITNDPIFKPDSIVYDGDYHYPTDRNWLDYNFSKMAYSTQSRMLSGSYPAKIIPLSGFCWDDGSIEDKTLYWVISKAESSLSLSETGEIILDGSKLNDTFEVTYTGDGVITVTSDNPNVEATISGTTVTVKNSAYSTDYMGEATITVGATEGTNYKAPPTQSVKVTYTYTPRTEVGSFPDTPHAQGISGLSARTIYDIAKAISKNPAITNDTTEVYVGDCYIWRKISVGDQITIPLSGRDYVFTVLGFNHDDLATNAHYDTVTKKAGITFQMQDCYAEMIAPMNVEGTAEGGWNSCHMRTDLMPQMKSSLPTDWRNYISKVNKKTSSERDSVNIVTSTDECFLLSVSEVLDSSHFGDDYPVCFASENEQYKYYKAGNSTIKKYNNTEGWWWLRSSFNDRSEFGVVTDNGIIRFDDATAYGSFSFAFCV